MLDLEPHFENPSSVNTHLPRNFGKAIKLTKGIIHNLNKYFLIVELPLSFFYTLGTIFARFILPLAIYIQLVEQNIGKREQ